MHTIAQALLMVTTPDPETLVSSADFSVRWDGSALVPITEYTSPTGFPPNYTINAAQLGTGLTTSGLTLSAIATDIVNSIYEEPPQNPGKPTQKGYAYNTSSPGRLILDPAREGQIFEFDLAYETAPSCTVYFSAHAAEALPFVNGRWGWKKVTISVNSAVYGFITEVRFTGVYYCVGDVFAYKTSTPITPDFSAVSVSY